MLYVGTYTGGESKGIYAYGYEEESGRCSGGVLAAKLENPSYLAASPDGNSLFAVSETDSFHGDYGGAVYRYRIDRENSCLIWTGEAGTNGSSPCHLCLSSDGKRLFAANYGDGSFTCFTVSEDGGIERTGGPAVHSGREWEAGIEPDRQERPHVHFVCLTEEDQSLWVVDLGLDCVFCYRTAALYSGIFVADSVLKLPNGYGPRHLVKHPKKPFLYILQELSARLVTVRLDGSGSAGKICSDISLLPPQVRTEDCANTGAALKLSADGRFLYATNRGHDSIAVFRVSEEGIPQAAGWSHSGGKNPRDISLSPDGRFLFCADQSSDCVCAFEIDREDGGLTRREELDLSVSSPVCVLFA